MSNHRDDHLCGVRTATVVDTMDPEGLGRVKVRLPWHTRRDPAPWARIATLMAGADRGTWFLPDVGDEVLVAFEAGDPDRPYVVGALWNDAARPPVLAAAGAETTAVHTGNGIVIELDDTTGDERLTLRTPAGREVVLDDGDASITVTDTGGTTVRLGDGDVSVTTPARVTIDAAVVEVAAGTVRVDAGMAQFSGVVKADTVVTNSVVSSSYTPGAGNIW